ncbi:UDP-glucosyltransferase 2 [Temnothorax nylanderi]|uniref:UDP-glucosyltransferase 2 n=1 Tax=Temnothorax nylanderi TaxID=102681 RepID=UPI003A87CC97
MKITATSLIVSICLLGAVDGARILAIFPANAKSHYNVYEPLLKRLSARGPEIFAVTHFPQRIRLANFTDLDISSTLLSMSQNNTLPVPEIYNFMIWQKILYISTAEICEPVLSHPEMNRIIKGLSKEHFDLLVIEIFATDCFLGIAHALNISKIVGAISTVGISWSNVMRNPENPSYIPNCISSYTGRMSLLERSINTVLLPIVKLAYRIISDEPSYEIARKYFGHDLPDFDALRSRISLILTNGHPAVSAARPLAPGVKEIGGIHIPVSGPKPLPVDLQDYLDSQSRNGVIYFSLGSQIDTSTIPNQVFAALYRAFEQVPQQILWTCTKERMPPLPGNVKCIGWAPQLSVLCHPNTRLLINHGGLLGLQEAIYCGIPILGIPLFGDHHLNMAYVVEKGLALQLDLQQFSYKRFSSSLNEILSNKSYTEMARKASFQFRDCLMPPVEEAVYWVEHTIRHDPDFLKTAATELTWYQYLVLDVALIIISIIVFVLWLICKLLGLLFSKKKISIAIDKKTK